jgi:hypothetical protein
MWYQSRNVKTPHDKADPHVYTSLARRHVLLLGLSGGHNILHVSNMETHAVFLSSWGLSSWRLSSCTAEQAPNVFAAVCLRQCHRDDFSGIIYFANTVLKFRHSNSSSLNHIHHCNSIPLIPFGNFPFLLPRTSIARAVPSHLNICVCIPKT